MAIDAARADTFPKLLIRNARLYGGPARLPAQGSRHLAGLDLGASAGGGARLCGRAFPPRAQARGHHRHRRFQPAPALLVGNGGADARRRSGAGLCRRRRRRTRLCARPFRRAFRRGRGSGAGRQDPVGLRSGCPSSSGSSTTSRGGCATTTTAASRRSTTSSRAAVPHWPRTPPLGQWLDREVEAGKGSDSLDHPLHLGNDGAVEGRRALRHRLHQRRLRHRRLRPAHRARRSAGVSAARLGRRSLSQLCAGAGRSLLPRLSGELRHRDAGHAGDRPDLLFRSAARYSSRCSPA